MLEYYQKLVLVIASVFIVLLFMGLGMLIQTNAKNQTFPPDASACPEYWTLSGDGASCVRPAAATTNYGKSDVPTATNGFATNSGVTSLTKSAFPISSVSDKCATKTKMDGFGIHWDGVTNFQMCPKASA